MPTDRPSELHALHVSFRRLPNSFSCSLSRAVSFPTPRAGRHKKSLAACAGRVEEFTTERRHCCCCRCGCGAVDCRQILKKTEISRVVVRDSTHTTIRRVARERERTIRPAIPTDWIYGLGGSLCLLLVLRPNQS